MKSFVISQERLIIVASALKSESLLYMASTTLSPRNVNKIIYKYFDIYLSEMCQEGICECLDNTYFFCDTINSIAKIYSNYNKKIEILEKIDEERYKAIETIFVHSNGGMSVCYNKNKREFLFTFAVEDRLLRCFEKSKQMNIHTYDKAFEFEMIEDDFVEVLENYGKEKFGSMCKERKVNELNMIQFADAVYTADVRLALMKECNDNKTLIYIYQKGYKNYLLITDIGDGKVMIACDSSINIIRKIMNS